MRILTGKDREKYGGIIERVESLKAQLEFLEWVKKELNDELQRKRVDCDRERQRADNAVDALLAMRGVPPVSPQLEIPPVSYENPLKEDPAEVERIEADMKRLGVGVVLAQEART